MSVVAIVSALGCSSGPSPASPSRAAVGSPAGTQTVSTASPQALFGASVVDFARCLQSAGDPGCFATGARMQTHAVGAAATAPGAPINLSTSSSGSTVTLTWGAPSSGDPVTTYLIEAGSGPGLANLANVTTNNTATSFSASGVGNGTYFIRIRAQNAGGTSAASNESTLVVGSSACTSAPNAPAGFAIAVNGSTLTLTWSAPAGGCAPSSYLLQAGASAGSSDLANANVGAGTTYVASGVGGGTYYVRVRAVNAFGQSAASNEVVSRVGGNTPSPTSVTGRWVGVTPDGIVLGPDEISCDREWDLQLDLEQSGTAVTGTATTKLRKVKGSGCDPIGLVEFASLVDGTVGSGIVSFRVLGGFADRITNFSGTFTTTRMTGTLGQGSSLGGSFAVNRQ